MRASFRIGRIAGVPVGVHWSLLVIGGLLASSLAVQIAGDGDVSAVAWFAAAGIAIAFFASILAHEVGHALVARRFGIGTDRIDLWVLGGVAQLRSEPATPRAAVTIAFAGPATSGLLAGVFTGLWAVLEANGAGVVAVDSVLWLALANGAVAIFNLLPASPLDGGRILHGLLWRIRHDRDRAGVTTARIGSVFGAVLVAIGVWQFAQGGSGLWTTVVGFFILSGSRVEEHMYRTRSALSVFTVGDVVSPGWLRFPAWSPVSAVFASGREVRAGDIVIVEDADPVTGSSGVADRRPVGYVTVAQLQAVLPAYHGDVQLRDLMVPLGTAPRAERSEPLTAVLDRMGRIVPMLTVWDGSRLAGIVTGRELAAASERLAHRG
jgi:Zn-dependent protease